MRLGLLPARRAGALGPPHAAGTTRRPPARRGRRGERPLLPLAPPLPLPGPRLARAGGGASTLAAAGLFPLVAAAARARKRSGAAAEAAEATRAARGCGAVLDSACPARGPAAMHLPAPGPLGDCLRDWEELQQDFQSIQVSAGAGAQWP